MASAKGGGEMKDDATEERWQRMAAEALSQMKQWRQEHPKATLTEIEEAFEERMRRLRVEVVTDVAHGSAAGEWSGRPKEERPGCPQCHSPLSSRGKRKRHLQSTGGALLVLERTYGMCPQCGAGLFPPG